MPASDTAEAEAPVDMEQALVPQIPDLKHEVYLEWVHDPYTFPKDPKTGKARLARMFGWDFFEAFSHTVWWVVPTVWVPIAGLFASQAVIRGTPLATLAFLVAVGIGFWWSVEYCLHRFIFHMDSALPDHPIARQLHFVLHGIHHKVPMDRYRLVMPPVLLAVLASAVYSVTMPLFCAFVPLHHFHVVFGAGLLGYVCYDVFHYAFHFIDVSWLPSLLAYNIVFLKKHHMKHHYGGDPNLGYGITTVFLDQLFGTVLPVHMPKNWHKAAAAPGDKIL